MLITNEIIKSYYECTYKAYLKLQGHSGHKCNFEKLYDREVRTFRIRFFREKFDAAFPKTTYSFTKEEPEGLHANVQLEYGSLKLKCDYVKTLEIKSKVPQLIYVPALIIPFEKVDLKFKILLAAAGYALSKILSIPVQSGEIIYSDKLKSTRIKLASYLKPVEALINKLNNQEPQFRLNSHCTICEFSVKCRERAIKEDHLSLLRGIGPDKIKKLNKKGIFTIGQLSYTFRPKRRSLVNHHRTSPRSFELQSLAIREKKIFVYDIPHEIPQPKVEIFLDVEGLPDKRFYYLIGLTVKEKDNANHHSFWVSTPEELHEVGCRFLKMLLSYGEFVIYHYGSYEVEFLQNLKKIVPEGNRHQIDEVIKRCFNILSLLYSHIYFPTYSNGLKEIGQFIGIKWTDKDPSGIESIVWRKEWQISKNEQIKQRIIRYNKEDCEALMALKKIVEGIISNNFIDSHFCIRKVSNLLNERRATFVINQSFFPEMKFINKCAYFDYQREKVYSKNKRKSTQAKPIKTGRSFYNIKPNKTIVIETLHCQNCKSKKITIKQHLHRKIADLKFTVSGVRRFIVQYYSKKYYCKKCKTTFIPDGYPVTKYRTGHNLMIWGIYHHIVNKQSFRVIEENIHELFNVVFSKTTFFICKSYFVKYYENTFTHVKEKVINSSVLYVDETPFNLQATKGYVWVLTNGQEVISVYKPTREANFVRELLKNFKGVLVTDFYTGYDAIDCAQQRCLIHLMRDFNSDLIRNPFNDEFKEIAKSFTVLLQKIVATIDRFGLKRHYLNKYKKQANIFLLKVKSTTYQTEIAQQYQIRIKRNEDKLFQFLSHDNVSWNNNNAEHAIKILALHANKNMNAYRETRIDDYLKIMSIYQTCKLKNISFLRFLRSKETNIDVYLEKIKSYL